MRKLIVTRHKGAVDWIHKHYPNTLDWEVKAEVSEVDVNGAIVIGVLPPPLASLTVKYFAIEFKSGKSPRGQEWTLEDMENAGATLQQYEIRKGDEDVSLLS
jgi:putative CRISPR-associated protein (TIGR02620 family)